MAQECASAKHLCDILDSERTALAGNKLELLDELATKKQTQIEQLEALGKKRIDWLSSRSIDTDSAKLSEYFTNAGNEQARAWQNLLTQLEECQQLNRVNGSIVKQLQKKIRNALSILQGQADSTDLYDQRGKNTSNSTTSILTRA
jgi:flagellar biosynthesis/type III secretory pathway chaperone